MDWLTIIGLILFGTLLLSIEIIFVPGTTLVGILGFIFTVCGVYLGYDYFEFSTGSLILVGVLILNVVTFIIIFQKRSWERFSLKGAMEGKFNDEFKVEIEEGDRGVTISSLKPIGKALFDDHEVEVRSNGGYIEENMEIEVLRIKSSKIFVQLIKN